MTTDPMLRDVLHSLAADVPVRDEAPTSMLKRARGRRMRTITASVLSVVVIASGSLVVARSSRSPDAGRVPPASTTTRACPTGWERIAAPAHPVADMAAHPNGDLWLTTGALQEHELWRYRASRWSAGPSAPALDSGENLGPTVLHVTPDGDIWSGLLYWVPEKTSVMRLGRLDGTVWRDTLEIDADTGYSISSSSNDNVWVLTSDPTQTRSQAFRFDGEKWAEITLPRPPGWSANFDSDTIVALADNDVWIFGQREARGHQSGLLLLAASESFFLHWDGREWSEVPSPAGWEATTPATAIHGGAESGNQIWFFRQPINEDPRPPQVARWDGRGIHSVTTEGLGSTFHPDHILVDGSGTAWLAGREPERSYRDAYSHTTYGPASPAVYKWNGVRWEGGRVTESLEYLNGTAATLLDDGGIAVAGSIDENLRTRALRASSGNASIVAQPTASSIFICEE